MIRKIFSVFGDAVGAAIVLGFPIAALWIAAGMGWL